jgi:hypothetical protein
MARIIPVRTPSGKSTGPGRTGPAAGDFGNQSWTQSPDGSQNPWDTLPSDWPEQ